MTNLQKAPYGENAIEAALKPLHITVKEYDSALKHLSDVAKTPYEQDLYAIGYAYAQNSNDSSYDVGLRAQAFMDITLHFQSHFPNPIESKVIHGVGEVEFKSAIESYCKAFNAAESGQVKGLMDGATGNNYALGYVDQAIFNPQSRLTPNLSGVLYANVSKVMSKAPNLDIPSCTTSNFQEFLDTGYPQIIGKEVSINGQTIKLTSEVVLLLWALSPEYVCITTVTNPKSIDLFPHQSEFLSILSKNQVDIIKAFQSVDLKVNNGT